MSCNGHNFLIIEIKIEDEMKIQNNTFIIFSKKKNLIGMKTTVVHEVYSKRLSGNSLGFYNPKSSFPVGN
jgi:hypothetical protein